MEEEKKDQYDHYGVDKKDDAVKRTRVSALLRRAYGNYCKILNLFQVMSQDIHP